MGTLSSSSLEATLSSWNKQLTDLKQFWRGSTSLAGSWCCSPTQAVPHGARWRALQVAGKLGETFCVALLEA